MSSRKRKRDLYDLVETGEYSDLTIHLSDGEELKCHRLILCTRCEFFAHALKSGQFKESNTGIIEMKQNPPAAVKALIEFLYTGEYDGDTDEYSFLDRHSAGDPKPLADAEVYAVASTYLVPDLERLAACRISEGLWYNASDILKVFPHLIKTIYGSVPESKGSLHNKLYQFATANLEEVLAGDRCLEMIQEAPEFMEMIFHDMSADAQKKDRRIEELEGQVPEVLTYKCPACSFKFEMVLPELKALIGCPSCKRTRQSDSWYRLRHPDYVEDYGCG